VADPCRDVLAKDRAKEERKDASLLERRRKQAPRQRASDPAARPLPRRDQLDPGGGVAKGDRSVRRERRASAHARPVPRGSLHARRRRRRDRPASCRRCGSAGRASGAPAGSPASYGASCNSTVSGPIACRQAAKERAGTTCCECWRRIGSSRRAANGACIASGSSTARWLICSAPTLASPRRTSSTPATTCCSLTNRRCSRI